MDSQDLRRLRNNLKTKFGDTYENVINAQILKLSMKSSSKINKVTHHNHYTFITLPHKT